MKADDPITDVSVQEQIAKGARHIVSRVAWSLSHTGHIVRERRDGETYYRVVESINGKETAASKAAD